MRKLVLFLIIGISSNLWAHGDHDHGGASIPVQRGGVMRSLETVNLELVYKDGEIQVYPFSVKGDPATPGKLSSLDPKSFPVSAELELPRTKAKPLALKIDGDHWSAKPDGKVAHRMIVIFKIKQGGHNDTLRWTIEPK